MSDLFRRLMLVVLALCALTSIAIAQEDEEPAAPPADEPADPPGQPDEPAGQPDDKADDDQKPDEPAGQPDDDQKPDEPAGQPDDDQKPDDDQRPDEPGQPDDDQKPDEKSDDDQNPDTDAAGAPDDGEPDGAPDPNMDTDGDGVSDAAEDDAEDVAVQEDEDGEPYIEADYDGDGVVEADELAEEKEYDEAYAGIPDEVNDDVLDARPEDAELGPSITVEHFRKLVRLAKRKVLERMEAKIEKKAEQRMAKISLLIFLFSLAGFLLLAMPFVLNKKYPGQMGNLFKYSALAAATFIVTVNLFGAIMLGMRTTQGALGKQTNPQLRIAEGTFDTLDENAERYIVTGKELFAPTLESLDGKSDDQPVVRLIENGQKIVEKATVFKNIAGMFKQLNTVLGLLPVVLLGVTLILFILAIKPTLMEIIKLPAAAASGAAQAGRDVVKRAMRRVGGEMLATVCTLGVLVLLSLLSGFVMGQVARPVLDTLLTCFARAVDYLQFVDGASAGQVALMLFSVILFLVLNLAAIIVSMSMFLGKTQKIFQQRFNEGVPLSAHKRWWMWAIPSVLVAQLIPLLYLFIARIGVEKIERSIMEGARDAEKVNWTLLMLASPGFLVVGFLVVFWAARGLSSVMFLARYKVKLPPSLPGQLAAFERR
jgi:hypothetical protein